MSALAIPALISGFVNSTAVANQVKRLADENASESQQRAIEEGIEILGARPVSEIRSPSVPTLLPRSEQAGRSGRAINTRDSASRTNILDLSCFSPHERGSRDEEDEVRLHLR
jgi:hypothetical protein